MMGSRIGPKENGTKEAWVARTKELTHGSGPEADSYGIRPEGDVSKATRIGNRVGVELEADYRSYGSPAIAHKRAEHSALKPIDQINL